MAAVIRRPTPPLPLSPPNQRRHELFFSRLAGATEQGCALLARYRSARTLSLPHRQQRARHSRRGPGNGLSSCPVVDGREVSSATPPTAGPPCLAAYLGGHDSARSRGEASYSHRNAPPASAIALGQQSFSMLDGMKCRGGISQRPPDASRHVSPHARLAPSAQSHGRSRLPARSKQQFIFGQHAGY